MVLYQRARQLVRRYGKQALQVGRFTYDGYKAGKKLVKGIKAARGVIRSGRSRTNTKKRVKRKRGNRLEAGEGASFMYKKVKYKVTRIARDQIKLGSTYNHSVQAYGDHYPADAVEVNSQYTNFVHSIWAPSQVTQLFERAYDLLPTTHPLYATDATATNPSMKFLLKRSITTIRFVNHDSAASTMVINIVAAKTTTFDTHLLPTTTWASAATLEESIKGDLENNIGNRPYGFKLFNMHFYKVKEYTVVLQPGAQHTLRFVFEPMSIVDATYFEQNGKVRGITHYVMMTQHGQLGMAEPSGGGAAVPINQRTHIISSATTEYSIQPISNFTKHSYYDKALDNATYVNYPSSTTYNADGIEVPV